MILYRVSTPAFASDLSGAGAGRDGGRWNSVGSPMVYCAMSRSLCLLEVLVHIPLDFAPPDYVVVQLSLPETARVAQLSPSKLPRDWNVFPYSESTQLVGDAFLREAKYLTMKVPSAIVPEEWNVLINPVHPLAASITILRVDPLILDPRFLRS